MSMVLLENVDYDEFDEYIDYYENHDILKEAEKYIYKLNPSTISDIKRDLDKYIDFTTDYTRIKSVMKCYGICAVYNELSLEEAHQMLDTWSREQICSEAEQILADILYEHYNDGYFDFLVENKF